MKKLIASEYGETGLKAAGMANPKAELIARVLDPSFRHTLFSAQHPNLKISAARMTSLALPKSLQTSILIAISTLDSGLPLTADHQKSLQGLSLWVRMQDAHFVGWEILTELHAVLSEASIPIIPFLNPLFDTRLTIENQIPAAYQSSKLPGAF